MEQPTSDKTLKTTRIKRFEIRVVSIPFRFSYRHARAKHSSCQSIICRAVSEEGIDGYGEAVPREYVTGETCASVIKDVVRLARPLVGSDLTFKRFSETLLAMAESELGSFPSCAYCALEGSILDLLAKTAQVPVSSFFSDEGKNPLAYAGSIGMSGLSGIAMKALAYRGMGFRHFKIKVGSDGDIARVKHIKRMFGRNCRFFADANGSWDREAAAKKIEKLSELGIEAIEEPLRTPVSAPSPTGQIEREAILDEQHYQHYSWLRERSPIPIIADESLISPGTCERILATQSFDILNIRLSKCGGFILGSQMARSAGKHSMAFAIGAMVAESPILANLGAQFGYVQKEHRYIQGFSHMALHKKRFTTGGARLKKGAEVRLSPDVAGHGVNVDKSALERLTTAQKTVE